MSVFLVTGGAGFIGSNTVHELVARGHTVRVLDNLATGRKENLLECWDSIQFIEGDITSLPTVKKACEGVDHVIHLAAIPSVPRSVENPLESNHANINGTLTLLVGARDAGVKRIVYAASSSAYGNQDAAVKTEMLPSIPLSPYAVAKLCGEHYMTVFNDLYGLQTVNLRYFNVFGPRQDPHSQYAAVIPLFINMILAGKSPTIHGDGGQSRDFTYVLNNVDANILACTAQKAAGHTINIACGTSITVNDLVRLINEYLGSDVRPEYTASRAGDVRHSLADISKAKSLLGFNPCVSVKEGLGRTIEWLKQRRT
ncbi:MAG: SDR family oxidoreductase [Nanoarchaeota archaeon]